MAQTARQLGPWVEPWVEFLITAAALRLWLAVVILDAFGDAHGLWWGAISAAFWLCLIAKFELLADKGNPTV